jgi:hypothetical protein
MVFEQQHEALRAQIFHWSWRRVGHIIRSGSHSNGKIKTVKEGEMAKILIAIAMSYLFGGAALAADPPGKRTWYDRSGGCPGQEYDHNKHPTKTPEEGARFCERQRKTYTGEWRCVGNRIEIGCK